jgi:hypothetical protein
MKNYLIIILFALTAGIPQINQAAALARSTQPGRPCLTLNLEGIHGAVSDQPPIVTCVLTSAHCRSAGAMPSEEKEESPLAQEIRAKAEICKQSLIRKQVDINSYDEEGKTFINTQAQAIFMRSEGIDPHDFACIYAGLALGADVNKSNKPKYEHRREHTPAIIDVLNSMGSWRADTDEHKKIKQDLVCALIRANADIFAEGSLAGKSAFELAVVNSNFPVVSDMFQQREDEIRRRYSLLQLGGFALDVVDRPYFNSAFITLMGRTFTETERTINDAKTVQLLAEKKADLSAALFGRSVLERALNAPQGSAMHAWAEKESLANKAREKYEVQG